MYSADVDDRALAELAEDLEVSILDDPLSPEAIARALRAHCVACVVEDGRVHADEYGDGSSTIDLTGSTEREIRDWLGY